MATPPAPSPQTFGHHNETRSPRLFHETFSIAELGCMILEQLTYYDLVRCRRVNKRFNALLSNPHLCSVELQRLQYRSQNMKAQLKDVWSSHLIRETVQGIMTLDIHSSSHQCVEVKLHPLLVSPVTDWTKDVGFGNPETVRSHRLNAHTGEEGRIAAVLSLLSTPLRSWHEDFVCQPPMTSITIQLCFGYGPFQCCAEETTMMRQDGLRFSDLLRNPLCTRIEYGFRTRDVEWSVSNMNTPVVLSSLLHQMRLNHPGLLLEEDVPITDQHCRVYVHSAWAPDTEASWLDKALGSMFHHWHSEPVSAVCFLHRDIWQMLINRRAFGVLQTDITFMLKALRDDELISDPIRNIFRARIDLLSRWPDTYFDFELPATGDVENEEPPTEAEQPDHMRTTQPALGDREALYLWAETGYWPGGGVVPS